MVSLWDGAVARWGAQLWLPSTVTAGEAVDPADPWLI